MSQIDLPQELSKTYWDKKKGAVPAGSPLETQLKTFEKKHQAVDWKAFADGWEKKAKTAAELDEAFAAVDRAYRSKVIALKFEGTAVSDAAQKLLKEKGLAKPTLDAVKAITDAAKAFGKTVDGGVDALAATHAKAAAGLKAAGKAEEGAEEEESAGILLDPKRLLSQLQMSKRAPERRAAFAMLTDAKKGTFLSLAPKLAGKRLFAKLQEETGIKTGAFGRCWILENVMYLEMEKPYSGVIKKVREALKPVGFKVSKIVLASEDGTVLESDDEPEDGLAAAAVGAATGTVPEAPPLQTAQAAQAAPAAAEPATSAEAEAYMAKLLELLPKVQQAKDAKSPVSPKLQPLLDFADGKAETGNHALALQTLMALEKMLGSQPAASAAPAAAANPAEAKPAPSNKFVNHAKARLAWQATRQKLGTDLKTLEQAILDHYRGKPDFNDLATKVRKFDTVLESLDTQLIDTLDEALNAADMDQRAAKHEEARGALARYRAYVEKEPLLPALDDNPFVPLTTHQSLLKTLQVLEGSLS